MQKQLIEQRREYFIKKETNATKERSKIYLQREFYAPLYHGALEMY